MNTDLVYKSMNLAIRYHAKGVRKDGSPELGHPFRVFMLVAAAGGDYMAQGGSLLHDSLEGISPAERLRREQQIRMLSPELLVVVRELTDDEGTTEARKAGQLLKYGSASFRAGLIKLCDRLDNLLHVDCWGPDKLRNYAEHSIALLAVLRGRHAAVEQVMEMRIREILA